MSTPLPTSSRLELPLLGRRNRVRAIIATGLRREFRRPAAIVVTVLGAAFTTITSIVLLIFAQILIPGQAADLTFFALPASNGFVLFFVSLMAAVIGAGLIADDMQSMAFTLYMSRPITQTDYLLAKAAILAPLVAMVTILPLLLTALVAALLGRVSWTIAVEAMGISLAIGGLRTAFSTAVTLFLSSLTRRKGIAAAGVFAVNFRLTVPARVLAERIGNASILYLSPCGDYVAVATVAFGATPTAIDWRAAPPALLGATALAAVVTYIRMRAVEVITG